ncbi:MAG: glycosyltransferase family 39 protein [Butyrivibrio sp.]|nr:glycosyltransferase family 39 protein [Butyrivibrio sp.]
MKELESDKLEKKIYDFLPHEPETMIMTLFVIVMAAYYFWRLFAITPQYDELYTYYTFISRGALYSAIHWPLPNNHVGYSVLSALLDHLGNPYIGLRGISYICAVANLYLVYKICKRYYSHALSIGAMFLYASMQVVNEYSVQGRGYTLATTCFLVMIYAAGSICSIEDTKRSTYIMMAIALILGLYTVPSSIYWVLPVCLAIAIYLIVNAIRSTDQSEKLSDSAYFKKFKRYFKTGIIAALLTTVLYMLIWLAIGSNLLVKDPESRFFGLSHVTLLVRSPVSALTAGIKYMLSQPYIQSLPRDVFWEDYPGYILRLFNYMLPGLSYIITFALIIGFFIAVIECVRHFAYSRTVINIIFSTSVVVTFVLLMIQHKQPYLRVFSYFSFIVVLAFCNAFEALINVSVRLYNKGIMKKKAIEYSPGHKETEQTIKDGKWYLGNGVYIPALAMVIVFIIRFAGTDFNMQLGSRENDVFNTMYIAGVEKRQNPAVLDCDQQYLMKFGWDIDCQKTDVDDSDCVIIDKNMMTPGYAGPDFWKFYQTYETIKWDYIKTMRAVYENDSFILYIK